MHTIIKNVSIINEGQRFDGGVLIENQLIKRVMSREELDKNPFPETEITIIDGKGMLLIPGIIDDQVHFREPGLTHKADIKHESRAAAAGGVTSFMEMPNTKPPAVSIDALEEKYAIAEEQSIANYSFYFGASNDNISELRKLDPQKVCGVKVFMGSSTGNMLVDDDKALSAIFAESPCIVATHCEDETTVRANLVRYQQIHGKDIPVRHHPDIRSAEACYRSSARAVELAVRYGTKLHVLHISTERELSLFETCSIDNIPRITSEVCVHHLWFCDEDYEELGAKIKCNPAIKSVADRAALRKAVVSGKLAVVATDHAPHTIHEKSRLYLESPSGLPLVQHSLPAMLEMCKQGLFSLETIVERMCHTPACLFGVEGRGFIREGYYADLVLINLSHEWRPDHNNILYKCGWSPFEGCRFTSRIESTWVNGKLVYDAGKIIEAGAGMRLKFKTSEGMNK
ncbi:MAG: dihydroorotase [Prevotellaceae bacterium]|jgi:dihydroorotase|nr:dihydroorotase [Prevotellaceae bacterium]